MANLVAMCFFFPVLSHQIEGVSVKCPINQGIQGRFILLTLWELQKGYQDDRRMVTTPPARDAIVATLSLVLPGMFFLSFKSTYMEVTLCPISTISTTHPLDLTSAYSIYLSNGLFL